MRQYLDGTFMVLRGPTFRGSDQANGSSPFADAQLARKRLEVGSDVIGSKRRSKTLD